MMRRGCVFFVAEMTITDYRKPWADRPSVLFTRSGLSAPHSAAVLLDKEHSQPVRSCIWIQASARHPRRVHIPLLWQGLAVVFPSRRTVLVNRMPDLTIPHGIYAGSSNRAGLTYPLIVALCSAPSAVVA